ncbi:Signal transduction histidine-protein kinase BarA [Aureliella helgolandensis]|uniref:histidine kinase n=1 Tax=Aureliella helgolandensis TaxID=2527968 RepID=A0A518G091_9BACT|nr:Signal transduction histidine-protein kinase BarA [Aureliella helgolandensis]
MSIKTKLFILASTSAVLALLIGFAGMAAHDLQFIRQSKVDQLESQAKMLAFNSTGVLTFQDQAAAGELLASMAMYPTVEYVCVYDDTGKLFAEFSSTPNSAVRQTESLPSGYRITDKGIEVFHPITDEQEQIGSIYVLANMSDLYAHIRRYLLIGAGIMLLSLAGAGAMSFLLQRSISEPVKDLALAAKSVKEGKDFAIRVSPQSNDELGELGVTFNSMLDEIQSSKAALQSANNRLEDRVQQRTAQLTQEIENRQIVQDALVVARDEAEAASRAKSEFLANMSHEIRTPLNGILGFAELLTQSSASADPALRQDYLETISSSGQHLLALINDILDLSKIEAGQLEVELSPCSPHDVLNQVVSVMRAQAQQKGLELRYEWKSKVPESIVTDGGRLRQLLMNLVGNAIKFTVEGSVRINAELDPSTETLTIRVIDTGIGIPSEKQSRIFSQFAQADNSVTRRYGGTGLGLAISRRLSSALGGELQVESQEGQGSVFILKVKTGPLHNVDLLVAPPADALMGTLDSIPVETIRLPASSVLLVEDGEINRKLVKIMLEDAGVSVTTAENGWLGVQTARREPFDLIVMDMQMPVMDGYTAASKIREEGITTPILALTAHAMKGDEEKCLAAGCSNYLTKPIRAAVLLSTVRNLLCQGKPGSVANLPPPTSEPVTPPSSAKYSPAQLKSTLPLEIPIYQEIVEEFVGFLNSHVHDMQTAYVKRDFEALTQLAHGLKGAGGTAGFAALTDPSVHLWDAAKEENLTDIEESLAVLGELTQQITATPQVC